MTGVNKDKIVNFAADRCVSLVHPYMFHRFAYSALAFSVAFASFTYFRIFVVFCCRRLRILTIRQLTRLRWCTARVRLISDERHLHKIGRTSRSIVLSTIMSGVAQTAVGSYVISSAMRSAHADFNGCVVIMEKQQQQQQEEDTSELINITAHHS